MENEDNGLLDKTFGEKIRRSVNVTIKFRSSQ